MPKVISNSTNRYLGYQSYIHTLLIKYSCTSSCGELRSKIFKNESHQQRPFISFGSNQDSITIATTMATTVFVGALPFGLRHVGSGYSQSE